MRNNNEVVYSGKMSEYQQKGNSFNGKKYSKIEYTILNSYQNTLYNRALHGLSVYDNDEIESMAPKKRQRIIKVHKRAQKVLNIWKQEIVNVMCARLFMEFFPKEKNVMTVELIESVDDTDSEFINTMSFKDLGMTKPRIIDKFIEEGILPPNFLELQEI